MMFPHLKSSRFQFILAGLVFMLCGTVLVTTWQPEQRTQLLKSQLAKEREIDNITSHFSTGFEVYVQTLYGARGLMTASQGVTRAEWKTFYQNIGVARRLPGLAALGYVQNVTASDREAFLANQKSQNDPDLNLSFTIHPETAKSSWEVLTYIEPLSSEQMHNALGFDYASEPVRSAALQKARAINQPVIASPIKTLDTNTPGFLVMLPVYNPKLPHTTPAERELAYLGLISIGFRNAEFFAQTLHELDLKTINVKVFDGDNPATANLLFDSKQSSQVLGKNNQPELKTNYTTVRKVPVADQIWTFEYSYQLATNPTTMIPSIWGRIAILVMSNLTTGLVLYHWMQLKKN